MATHSHTHRRGSGRRPLVLAVVVAASFLATAKAAGSATYDWPLKPFDRQHHVRAYFNDPRIGGGVRQFHFGIDISAADGTAVYSVEAGIAHVVQHPGEGASVEVTAARGFAYWHVVPVVKDGQHVERHQLIATVAKGWRHVHFAEMQDGRWINPLRPGALTPFADTTAPAIVSIAVVGRGRRTYSDAVVRHPVDLVVDTFDRPAMDSPDPKWWGIPVTPALIRWRITGDGTTAVDWRTAVDFRIWQLAPGQFAGVYAPGTRQNHEREPGDFRFYLARGWDPQSLPAAAYRLEVEVTDVGGNRTASAVDLRVARP
jgi:hypothetical protein